MTPKRHAKVRAAFLEAASRPAEVRAQYLDEVCGTDSEMRNEVELLLAHHTMSAKSRETAAAADDVEPVPPDEPPSGIASPHEFRSGHMIAGRYRIQCKVGQGGMGVVYRAEDVVLNCTIAIKFLAWKASHNAALVERFRSEVRMAHRVSHRNVCRVFDIGEADGQTFLTMYFCDGEDLGRLIRRIGRLPFEKGCEIARQICTGLAAAHGAGVLHRDLKPSNILLDAKGTVLITDFGIASAVDATSVRDIAGTPGYMAPEQIIGIGVDQRCDIYSLGLVLYEMFSGRPAFVEKSLGDYLERQIKSMPTPMSEVAPGIDRDLELLIHRCVSKNRDQRPSSALAVAASLPGADALAMALEADQTASPNFVANSTRLANRLKRPEAWAIAAIACCLMLPVIRLWSGYPWDASDSHPPSVLLNLARTAMREALPGEQEPYSAFGYCDRNRAKLLFEQFAGNLPPGQTIGSKRGLFFWYRESKTPLDPTSVETLIFGPGHTTSIDPPLGRATESLVLLDDRGRLLGFVTAASGEGTSTSQQSAFVGAAQLKDIDSQSFLISWNGRFADIKCEGRNAKLPDSNLGQLVRCALGDAFSVFFVMEYEESVPASIVPLTTQVRAAFVRDSMRHFYIIAMIASLPLAFRNLQLIRCDIQGAGRLFLFFISISFVAWLFRTSRSGSGHIEISLIFVALLRALGLATMVVVLYFALEPAARKYWPHVMITWTHILQIRSGSTALWHHVLAGITSGVAIAVLLATNYAISRVLWGSPAEPIFVQQVGQRISGLGSMLAAVCGSMISAVGQGFLIIFLLSAAHWVTGRRGVAVIVTGVILLALIMPRGPRLDLVSLIAGTVGVGLILWVGIQYGVLSLVLLVFVAEVLNLTPMTFRPTVWFFPMSITFLSALAAMVVCAYTKAQSSLRRGT